MPALLIERAKEYAPDTSVALVFAFTPVVVVLVSGAISQESTQMRRLVPAVMGLAGVLLLLPFERAASWRAWEAVSEVAAAMLLVSGSGVWLYALSREMKTTEALAVVGSSNAALLLAWCGTTGKFDWRWRDLAGPWWASLAGVVVPGLTVWLLQRIEPVRFSARFLVIPLVTILEGLVLLRPELTARIVVGTLLVGAGATWMLTAKQRVDEEVLSLR
jgi:drug/metabolite transporter (DMT)-like permease